MRVLVIAAHPDDEDTQLITWLTRGRHVETAYLALTRGDGGQNLLGNELGEALGVIRTEELLAARRLDGGRQYFTRAYDFGFSKSADETFRHWPRDSILRDVVTVVRSFKPHVIVAMFSGTPRDGHGHHQASGILAREAYDVAGDTVRFPRSATEGQGAWAPLKFYRGAWAAAPTDPVLRINVGEFDPMAGRSYAEIAAESRSQHKSQAFGSLQPKGARFTQVRREATRVNESQVPGTERSMFDGIDTTWARFKTAGGSPAVAALIDSLVGAVAAAKSAPYLRTPSTAVPALLRAMDLLRPYGSRPNDPELAPDGGVPRVPVSADLAEALRVEHGRVSRALAIATGVAVEAQVERPAVAEGDSVGMTVTVYNRGTSPMEVHPESLAGCGGRGAAEAPAGAVPNAVLLPDSSRVWRGYVCAATGSAQSPYWLVGGRSGDVFRRASLTRSEAEATAGQTFWVSFQAPGDPTNRKRFDISVPIVYRS
ncbi:MAG TPA: PIG-L family deacetylase, partial [Gemmatimonadaceae bacterium]|nr:PIG-L family deacetylase [Gemmatimonadaceae bacterium]